MTLLDEFIIDRDALDEAVIYTLASDTMKIVPQGHEHRISNVLRRRKQFENVKLRHVIASLRRLAGQQRVWITKIGWELRP
jgi:hypothetical protein